MTARQRREVLAPLRAGDRPTASTVDVLGCVKVEGDTWRLVTDVDHLACLLLARGVPRGASRDRVLAALQLAGYWPGWYALNAYLARCEVGQ